MLTTRGSPKKSAKNFLTAFVVGAVGEPKFANITAVFFVITTLSINKI